MNGLLLLAIAAALLLTAYLVYGRYLVKTWGIDSKAKTPAYEKETIVNNRTHDVCVLCNGTGLCHRCRYRMEHGDGEQRHEMVQLGWRRAHGMHGSDEGTWHECGENTCLGQSGEARQLVLKGRRAGEGKACQGARNGRDDRFPLQ